MILLNTIGSGQTPDYSARNIAAEKARGFVQKLNLQPPAQSYDEKTDINMLLSTIGNLENNIHLDNSNLTGATSGTIGKLGDALKEIDALKNIDNNIKQSFGDFNF